MPRCFYVTSAAEGEGKTTAAASLALQLAQMEKKVLLLERAGLVFAFNFNPEHSFDNYGFAVPAGAYQVVLDSDAKEFGGFGRNDTSVRHLTRPEAGADQLYLYLPSRTVQVLKKI